MKRRMEEKNKRIRKLETKKKTMKSRVKNEKRMLVWAIILNMNIGRRKKW